jgi:hypothetical protein
LAGYWDGYLAERELFYDPRWAASGGAYFWNNAGNWLWKHLVGAGLAADKLVGPEKHRFFGSQFFSMAGVDATWEP